LQRQASRLERELPSEGVVSGSIQVPPSGQPVVFLADHPVTGGYPVVAVLLDADIDRAAQAVPGQQVRIVLEADRPAWEAMHAPSLDG
jgi:allophanate hydrolase subunit 2